MDDQVSARLVGVAERQAADAAVGPRTLLGQAVEARQQPRAVDPKILTHLMAPGPDRRDHRSHQRSGDPS
jgi:hypothetical protein